MTPLTEVDGLGSMKNSLRNKTAGLAAAAVLGIGVVIGGAVPAQAAEVAPKPPICTGQKIVMYSVGFTGELTPVKPYFGVGVEVVEHIWYSARPIYKPGTRLVQGWDYKYQANTIGQDFGYPRLSDPSVLCLRT